LGWTGRTVPRGGFGWIFFSFLEKGSEDGLGPFHYCARVRWNASHTSDTTVTFVVAPFARLVRCTERKKLYCKLIRLPILLVGEKIEISCDLVKPSDLICKQLLVVSLILLSYY
jgi:hypothetical protein